MNLTMRPRRPRPTATAARPSPPAPALLVLSVLTAAALLHPRSVTAGPVGAVTAATAEPDLTTQSSRNASASSTACWVGGAGYRAGEEVPAAAAARGACEQCACGSGGELSCRRRACAARAGCKALHTPDDCCPKYQCDCEQDGRLYANGEKLVDAADPCKVCYCQGGEVVCRRIACFLRADCEPRPARPGRCCPEYDHCPLRGAASDADKSVGITTSVTSSTVTKMFENISQISKENVKKEITIKEVTPVSEIPAITGVRIKEVLPSPFTAAAAETVVDSKYATGTSSTTPQKELSTGRDAHRDEALHHVEDLNKQSSSVTQPASPGSTAPEKNTAALETTVPSPRPPPPSPATSGKPPQPEEEEPFELVNPAFPPLPDDFSVLSNHEEETGEPHTELPTSPPSTSPPLLTSPPSTSPPSSPYSNTSPSSPPSPPSPLSTMTQPLPSSQSPIPSSPAQPLQLSPSTPQSPPSAPSPSLPPSPPSPLVPSSPLLLPSTFTPETTLNAITEGTIIDLATGGLVPEESGKSPKSTERPLKGKPYKVISTLKTPFSNVSSALLEELTIEPEVFDDVQKLHVTTGDPSPLTTVAEEASGASGPARGATRQLVEDVTALRPDEDAASEPLPSDDTLDSSTSQVFTETLATDAPSTADAADIGLGNESTLAVSTDAPREQSPSEQTSAIDSTPSESTEKSRNTEPAEGFQFDAEVSPIFKTNVDSNIGPSTSDDREAGGEGEAPRAALIAPPAANQNNVLTDLINLVGDVASFKDHTEKPAPATSPATAEIEREEGELPVTDAQPPHDDTEPTTRRPLIDRVSHDSPSVAAAPPSRDIEIITKSYVPSVQRRPTKLMKKNSERAEPGPQPSAGPAPGGGVSTVPAPVSGQ